MKQRIGGICLAALGLWGCGSRHTSTPQTPTTTMTPTQAAREASSRQGAVAVMAARKERLLVGAAFGPLQTVLGTGSSQSRAQAGGQTADGLFYSLNYQADLSGELDLFQDATRTDPAGRYTWDKPLWGNPASATNPVGQYPATFTIQTIGVEGETGTTVLVFQSASLLQSFLVEVTDGFGVTMNAAGTVTSAATGRQQSDGTTLGGEATGTIDVRDQEGAIHETLDEKGDGSETLIMTDSDGDSGTITMNTDGSETESLNNGDIMEQVTSSGEAHITTGGQTEDIGDIDSEDVEAVQINTGTTSNCAPTTAGSSTEPPSLPPCLTSTTSSR